MTTQKLELTWIGKEKRPKLEPRILSKAQKNRVVPNIMFSIIS